MLIGISGKMGSGKDTVGLIIQYLMLQDEHPEYYKDLSFDDIIDLDIDQDQHQSLDIASSVEIKKFAYKLKQIVGLLTNASIEELEDQYFKSTTVPGWGMTYRELLQKVGTDAMRDQVLQKVWEMALFVDYKVSMKVGEPKPVEKGYEFPASDIVVPNWVITDTRFENEAAAIKNRNGLVIRVVRRSCSECKSVNTSSILNFTEKTVDGLICKDCNTTTDYTKTHQSETALDNYKNFDHIILNEGSIDQLIEEVRVILIDRKFIKA
jgi:hypothetical protein